MYCHTCCYLCTTPSRVASPGRRVIMPNPAPSSSARLLGAIPVPITSWPRLFFYELPRQGRPCPARHWPAAHSILRRPQHTLPSARCSPSRARDRQRIVASRSYQSSHYSYPTYRPMSSCHPPAAPSFIHVPIGNRCLNHRTKQEKQHEKKTQKPAIPIPIPITRHNLAINPPPVPPKLVWPTSFTPQSPQTPPCHAYQVKSCTRQTALLHAH